jgi:hypothetical protein
MYMGEVGWHIAGVEPRESAMYTPGEVLIYDNIYPVRFEGRQDATLAIVSEDGGHFFARWSMLRRPTYPKGEHDDGNKMSAV